MDVEPEEPQVRRNTAQALFIAGVSVTSLIVTAPPASAYSFEYNVAYDPAVDPAYSKSCMLGTSGYPSPSYGCYMAYNDNLIASDFAADGMSTGVQWKTDYGRYGICRNTMGNRSIGFCNKDFAEGKKITFRFGRCDGDVYACNSATGWQWETGWHTVST